MKAQMRDFQAKEHILLKLLNDHPKIGVKLWADQQPSTQGQGHRMLFDALTQGHAQTGRADSLRARNTRK